MLALAVLCLASSTKQIPLIDLHCHLDPEHASMHISSSVILASKTQDTTKATFFLADQMDVPKVSIQEPQELAGEVSPKVGSTHDHSVTYEVDLPKPLPAGKRLKLKFDYASKVDHGFVYLLSAQECLAGGYNTCWFPSVGDSRHMEGSLEFESPAGYIVKASGKEVSATESGGTRTTRFEIQQPIVPTFAAARFVVTHVEGAVPTTLYLLKARPIATEYAGGCAKILEVLTKQNGPYPFPDFSIIETPSPESSRDLGFSGASFEGFMFADSNGIDGGFNLAYYGHEIGHQWWGNLVGLDGDEGGYIFSEGLAQFGSLQCVKAIAGAPLAEQYRRWGYPNYSDRQSLFGSLFYGPCGYDRALLDPPKDYSVFFHQLANSKGFLVWETLARTMGHRNFAAALQAVTKKYAWANVTWDQLFAELQDRTKLDLKVFQEEWFKRKGAPCAWMNWTQDGGKIKLVLEQTAPLYHLQMPVIIRLKDGTEQARDVSFSEGRSVQEFPVQGEVSSCLLDPHFDTYHTTPVLNDMVRAMKEYGNARFFMSLMPGVPDYKTAVETALKTLPNVDIYGAEFLERSMLSAVLFNAKDYSGAQAQCRLALACPSRRPDFLPGLYLRMAQIAKETGTGDANDYLRQLISAESAAPWPTGAIANAKKSFPDYDFEVKINKVVSLSRRG